MIRSLWAAVQGDPVSMMHLNKWLTFFWMGMMPLAIWTGWIYLSAFISLISIYTCFTGHWSTYQAARVEVNQLRAEKANKEAAVQKAEETATKVARDVAEDQTDG
jgi:hypothetical protein